MTRKRANGPANDNESKHTDMLYIKDGVVRDRSRVVIRKDGTQVINPTDEMVLADGWTPYEPETIEYAPTVDDQLRELLLDEYNGRTDITDGDALKRPLLVYPWDSYVGRGLTGGQIVSHNDRLWRVRQDIASVLGDQPPSLDTAALYGVIEVEADGSVDNPIAYAPPMEISEGRYYTQGGVKYRCVRSSGQELAHDLAELVGTYVENV